ncbi:hypothetical protein [Xylella taiwanensis]|nr:hypothetical protein [Xylella taiwanensis]
MSRCSVCGTRARYAVHQVGALSACLRLAVIASVGVDDGWSID